MIQIDDTLVSFDVFKETFCCDLAACHGNCCVEGDAGAPLEPDEIAEIEKALPAVWDRLSQQARIVINKQGVSYKDPTGDDVTSIVNGKDCVFTCYDEKGTCFCTLEKAWREGKTTFQKPISCHLYPIRLNVLRNGLTALNYHRWSVCTPAFECGRELQLPVYKFLKEPLIRKFGSEWYEKLETAARWLAEHPENQW